MKTVYTIFSRLQRTSSSSIERWRQGGKGAPCFRKYGRDLVSKLASSFKEKLVGLPWNDSSYTPKIGLRTYALRQPPACFDLFPTPNFSQSNSNCFVSMSGVRC